MSALNKATMYDLGLRPKVVKTFQKENITMGDILANKYSLSYFARIPNIGKKSIKDIKEAFLIWGFKFSDNDEHFPEIDHYLNPKSENNKNEQNHLYINLNLQVIDKCRETLISSFNNIVNRRSFTHNEFVSVMSEHKKILEMFEQNVKNVL